MSSQVKSSSAIKSETHSPPGFVGELSLPGPLALLPSPLLPQWCDVVERATCALNAPGQLPSSHPEVGKSPLPVQNSKLKPGD